MNMSETEKMLEKSKALLSGNALSFKGPALGSKLPASNHAPSAMNQPPPVSQGWGEESMEDRTMRMKQQRELLLQKKKEIRDSKLDDFNEGAVKLFVNTCRKRTLWYQSC
jgi:hypothetical protein